MLKLHQTLRGHHGSALSHIESGVKILSQIDEDERQSPKGTQPSQLCVPRECLDVVFARLDMQRVQVRSNHSRHSERQNRC